MQKLLIVAGIILLLVGVFWPHVCKFPIGRLPGDIVIDRPGFKVYIPITTMILVSIIVSVLVRVFRK